ncbi:unnamed protein product [Didymodactylos carnosus]|uniref:Uncharacterized protein n=1 Tax=Didymodactylos carnosus TaxID=1234261 RepID=A0A814A195_9BILA|nr:unnamed protein product [Didymodactylos carnosus]CAF3689643.1 unnamed protein product [Didymodactylos carnosus]
MSEDVRSRCRDCAIQLYLTKYECVQSIQRLLQQQQEIDECIANLHDTKTHAQAINEQVYVLDESYARKFCQYLFCGYKTEQLRLYEQSAELIKNKELDDQNLLILPFPQATMITTNGIKTNIENTRCSLLDRDRDLSQLSDYLLSLKLDRTYEFKSEEEFQKTLNDEYTVLYDLAKTITKCVQIIHDAVFHLSNDINVVQNHMNDANPRIKQMLAMRELASNF